MNQSMVSVAIKETNTAIMKAKLHMQLEKRATCPLFFVFLDLENAYDTLDNFLPLED
jgi:hypothetical protein